MAQLHSGYTTPRSEVKQQYRPSQLVQCTNCNPHTSPQERPQNGTHSRGWSNSQFVGPTHRSLQSGVQQPTSYVPAAYSRVFDSNQQKVSHNADSRQYTPKHAPNMNDLTVRRIRDILIDILNSSICKYGITVSQLLIFLKHSCANYDIILPTSITVNFKEFLGYEMMDYVEIQDDLCRYRRPTLSIREEDISSIYEGTYNRSKACIAGVVPRQALQRHYIMPAVATNGCCSTEEMDELKNANIGSTEKPSSCLAEFRDNKLKSKQFIGEIEDRHRNVDSKTSVAAPGLSVDYQKCKILAKHVESNAISKYSYTRNDLAKIVEEWKEIFLGDLKELIRYLLMVDGYFQKNGGKFTWSEFKEVFGELNKRWEFCDIDLIEMGVINVLPGYGLNEEPVFIVSSAVREVEFPEVAELAKEVYNFLSKLLESENSVKVEVVARAVNFGINNWKTVKEKYALLWEVLSDSQFQDIFVVDVLQKQNKERGFDVMIRLNPNINFSGTFVG